MIPQIQDQTEMLHEAAKDYKAGLDEQHGLQIEGTAAIRSDTQGPKWSHAERAQFDK